MKESFGLTFTINIIIVFILVVFVFVLGSISYARAFKSGTSIVNAIEKYSGYNNYSLDEINNKLGTAGYDTIKTSCAETKKSFSSEGKLVSLDGEQYNYCVYLFDNDGNSKYYSYGVVTYMTIDFTMFNVKIKIPMLNKTQRLYKFSKDHIEDTNKVY